MFIANIRPRRMRLCYARVSSGFVSYTSVCSCMDSVAVMLARRKAPLGQDAERRDAVRLVERVETERMDRGTHERLHARMEQILREVASSPAH